MREHLTPHPGGVYDLIDYHLGWDAPDAPLAGKLLRPTICLTVAAGYGDPERAIDAAVSLELLHAFTLVHDDIEDGDIERHHRPTLWASYGVPLAINAGDSLFAQAHRVLDAGIASLSPQRALLARRIFDDASLKMIEAQHADLDLETAAVVQLEAYVEMTAGKTGALLGASLALGAVFAGASEPDVELLSEAGVMAGIAFQAVDDALAFWGDSTRTGKATGNDLARGKKSLPVVLAAVRGWNVAGLSIERSASLRAEAMAFAADYAGRAKAGIDSTQATAEAREELKRLIEFLVIREY